MKNKLILTKNTKSNNPEKTADLTVQPGEPYSDLNKIFILFKWGYRPFSSYRMLASRTNLYL